MLKATTTTATPPISTTPISTTVPLKQNPLKNSRPTPIVLTIAGSDSGGGAGIQADIKAISATGSYACSAITAITAQNTLGVSAIFPIPLEHINNQLDAVFSDLNVIAVKVGMWLQVGLVAGRFTLEIYLPDQFTF